MADAREQRVREIFDALLDTPAAAREARLDELCTDDADLRQRVEQLLQAYERATAFNDVILPGPDTALEDPEQIGSYRVLERLGEGGMGVVYLAEQKVPVRRKVAIKIIRPGMASKEVINRFNAERQALALMTHPGIARILDGGATEQGLPYFVMEYVPGTPIIKYCEQMRLDLRQRIELARQVCLAVQHAHQKGIIHRDLKPSNILVSEEDDAPMPKVIDFGIAKAISQPLTDATLHTRVGLLIGTPDYMSPEQCSQGSLDVDTRSDVYALGVLLYELLSGRLPFEFHRDKTSDAEIVRRIQSDDPPPPSVRVRDTAAGSLPQHALGDPASLQRRLRGELDWIVMRALERDRNRRYESAQALADELQRFLQHQPVIAGPPTLRYRTGKFVRRHYLAVTMLGSAVAMLAAFATLMAWQVQQTRLERDRANREAGIAREVTRFTAGLFELANPEIAGSSKVTAQELLDAGVRRIQLRDMQGQDEVRAALLAEAGIAYRGLGNYEASRELLQEALELRHAALESDPAAYAEVLLAMTQLERRRGNFDAAEQYNRKALEHLDPARAQDKDSRFTALLSLSSVLFAQSRLDEAAELLESGLVAERLGTGSGRDKASALLQLGRVRLAQGNLDEAEELLRQSLQLNVIHNGELSDNTLGAKSQLADVLAIKGKADEAEPLLYEIVAAKRRIFGDDHPEVGVALNNLGNALSDFPDKLDAAEDAYREGLDIIIRSLGEMHPEAGVIFNNLGTLNLFRQEWSRAERDYAESIRIRMQVLGPQHANTAGAQVGRALALNRLDRFAEAEELLRAGVETFGVNVGEHSWRTANARLYLGMVLYNQAKFEEAERQLRMAHEDLSRELGEEHWRSRNAELALGEMFEKMERFDEAEAILRTALAGLETSLGPDHLRTQRAREQLDRVVVARSAVGR